jgi:hypothetical protein
MMKLSAYVIELPDNAYKVGIEGVYTGIVSGNDTFDSALADVIERMLSYDYDYEEVAQAVTRKGRCCRVYVVTVDNGDD